MYTERVHRGGRWEGESKERQPPTAHPQGILNFMEQLIEENLLPFPLDLSPYDFVATNCHTADEEASHEKEKEIEPEPLFLRSISKLVIGA